LENKNHCSAFSSLVRGDLPAAGRCPRKECGDGRGVKIKKV